MQKFATNNKRQRVTNKLVNLDILTGQTTVALIKQIRLIRVTESSLL